jgi:hypothetical protein
MAPRKPSDRQDGVDQHREVDASDAERVRVIGLAGAQAETMCTAELSVIARLLERCLALV